MNQLQRSRRGRRALVCLLLIALLLPAFALASDVLQVDATQVAGLQSAETRIMYVDNPDNAERLYMRAEPETKGAEVGRYFNGTVVEVTGPEQGGYLPVRIGPNTGYMQAKFLSETPTFYDPGFWATVNVGTRDEKLNLRTSVEEGAPSLGLFYNGTAVYIIEDAGDFFRVRTRSMDGFMHKLYLQLDSDGSKPVYAALTGGTLVEEAVPMYAFPAADAAVLGTYPAGTELIIHNNVGVWYYVEVTGENLTEAQRQKGFMLSRTMSLQTDDADVIAGTRTFAVVKNAHEGDKLVLRAAPAWSSENLNAYFDATQVEVLDHVEPGSLLPTWTHVRAGELEGYMQGEFLNLIAAKAVVPIAPPVETEAPAPEGDEGTPEEIPAEGDGGGEDAANDADGDDINPDEGNG